MIHLQPVEGDVRDLPGDHSIPDHLCIIPNSFQHTVGDTGGSPAAFGKLLGPIPLTRDSQYGGAAQHNFSQLLRCVQFQTEQHSKPIPQRAGELTGPGGCAYQRKFGQIDTDGTGGRTFSQNNIQRKILHRWVQNLLHRSGHPVDLVDKQNIVGAEIGQQRREISWFFDGRTGSDAKIDPHLIGNDGRKGGFSQSGRAIKQYMIQRFSPPPGCLNIDGEILLHLLLSHIFPQGFGTKRQLQIIIRFCALRGGHPSLKGQLVKFAHAVSPFLRHRRSFAYRHRHIISVPPDGAAHR